MPSIARMPRIVLAIIMAMAVPWVAERPRAEEQPVIAAAADLQFALEEIAALFKAHTGKGVRLSFGSSGNFRRQIAQGAPFQLYLSADEGYVLALYRQGLTVDKGALYALGRVVLMAPHGAPLEVDGELRHLAAALEEGRITRFAIANPEHAPYGVAAMEALKTAGLWEAIQPYLVLGENVSQAAQFALSGTAQGGIIAYSLALSPQVAARGRFELIPADWHRPLCQRMVLIKGAGETAMAFYDFVRSAPAQEVLRNYGFVVPGESP